ncbi:YdcF family protein [Mucilaginibacter terrenus]|nr:YdcF family protein [Mucilaginibacter terrenus]
MYFILSKVLYILTLPFLWSFGLLVYAIVTKSAKRRYKLLIAGVALLYVFGNPLLLNLYARGWDEEPYNPGNRKFSCIILLGGFVSEDESGHGFLNDSKDRYTQATLLLKNKTASHLLMTGGNGNLNPSAFSEGAYVRELLHKQGFLDSAIFIESKARNTFENASLSHAIIKKAGLKPPYLLVTSAFHMKRAELIFKKEGLQVVGYPCDYKTLKSALSLYDFLPSSVNYDKWNLYIKELIGYVVAVLK